jgi:methyl-accepting chemotaxis protein
MNEQPSDPSGGAAAPSRPEGAARTGAGARRGGLLGQRRSFLVNKRYQLRASLLTAAVVLVLLVFLNLILYATTLSSAEQILADAPELAAVIKAQDRVELYLIVLASCVYLLGVFLITVLETHRTAGAAYNLGMRLGEIGQGRFKTRLTLRKGDNLRELEEAFNSMTRSLQDRTWEEIESLAQLARDAEESGDGRKLADKLRELAESKRRQVE